VQPWFSNLIGVLLGLAIGGAGVAVFLAFQPAPQPVHLAMVAATPLPPPALPTRPPPLARPQARMPVAQVIQPVELPPIAMVPEPRNTMPNIIYPDAPPQNSGPHPPGSGTAGTGFFVAADGTLLTAAHVVKDCRQTRIVSKLVRPAVAQLLATNVKDDIALLRAANVTPPAVLSVGRPASSAARLFVLGYPASAGPLVPAETWATMENAKLQPAPPELSDPSRIVWVAGPAIQHGYSGGPMVDPSNGEVVGIVKGMVDSVRLHASRPEIPGAGIVIGPGSAPLTALLQQQGADDDGAVETVSGDDALDIARRATVHVLCFQ
jgi:S1-C subfamily serine protease